MTVDNMIRCLAKFAPDTEVEILFPNGCLKAIGVEESIGCTEGCFIESEGGSMVTTPNTWTEKLYDVLSEYEEHPEWVVPAIVRNGVTTLQAILEITQAVESIADAHDETEAGTVPPELVHCLYRNLYPDSTRF